MNRSFSRAWTWLCILLLAGLTGLPAANLPPGFRSLDEKEFSAAGLDPQAPELKIEFPAAARNRGLAEGWARLSVAVDAGGNAVDFILVGYSDPAFGRSLLEWVKPLKFQAAKYRGKAVPGTFEIGYQFQSGLDGGVGQSFRFGACSSDSGEVMVASAVNVDLFTQKATREKPAYDAVQEKHLDQPLEFVDVALPKIPRGYTPPSDKPVKVFVSFYIDEQGKVRAPRVESEATPEMIASALKAVSLWSFKPPLAQGKPALVLTARSVGFLPRES